MKRELEEEAAPATEDLQVRRYWQLSAKNNLNYIEGDMKNVDMDRGVDDDLVDAPPEELKSSDSRGLEVSQVELREEQVESKRSKRCVYYQNDEGIWKCRKCCWTYQSERVSSADIQNSKKRLHKPTHYQTVSQQGSCFSCETKGQQIYVTESSHQILVIHVVRVPAFLTKTYPLQLLELKNDQKTEASDQSAEKIDQYHELLGQRRNFVLHAVFAILSYLTFGLLPPFVYGFSFQKSDNRDLKLATVAAFSLLGIIILAAGKAYDQRAPISYVKTVAYWQPDQDVPGEVRCLPIKFSCHSSRDSSNGITEPAWASY